MSDKKITVTIKSNGSVSGTSLLVNGVDITKEKNVTNIYFSCWGDDGISLSWNAMEEDKDGIKSNTSYSFNSSNNTVERYRPTKFIGEDSELQFETVEDATAYKVFQKPKRLEENIKLVDKINDVK